MSTKKQLDHHATGSKLHVSENKGTQLGYLVNQRKHVCLQNGTFRRKRVQRRHDNAKTAGVNSRIHSMVILNEEKINAMFNEVGISCKWKGKKVRVVILMSNKIDFKTKAVVKDKEGHYIMITGTTQQEDITLENIYTPNIGAPKYVKQILMDIAGDFNTH